jgi:hypothetical protein
MKTDSIHSHRSLMLASAALVLLGLGGCTSKVALEPGYVEGRWAQTMDFYNFTAVFPPRDVMVGDLFLVFRKSDKQLAQLSQAEQAEEKRQENQRFFFRLTRLDVRSLIKTDWQKRINLPSTGQSGSSKPVDIFATQKNFTTLPTAAFIGYNIVNITEGQAGVAFPVHLFRTFLGGAFEDQLALSISVPSAQFVELPAIDAFNTMIGFCGSPRTKKYCLEPNWTEFDRNDINDPVTYVVRQYTDQFGVDLSDPSKYKIALIFITNVLYAQSIQYSYSTENGSAFSAAVTPIASLSSGQTKASGATATSQTASEGGMTINVTGGSPTATNGGATACVPAAAKTDQNQAAPTDQAAATDQAAPKKQPTPAELKEAVTKAEADATKAEEVKTAAVVEEEAAVAKENAAKTDLDAKTEKLAQPDTNKVNEPERAAAKAAADKE